MVNKSGIEGTSNSYLLLCFYCFFLIFRLTPSYAYLLFLSTYIGPILGSGPNWYLNGPDSPQSENCISYWWTNLLYINNLYPKQENMVRMYIKLIFFLRICSTASSNSYDLVKRTILALINTLFLDWFTVSP